MVNFSNLALIFVGGGLGACARWLIDNVIAEKVRAGLWPLGTMTVNLLGCLLIGVLLGVLSRERDPASWIWLVAATGFLGGLTTFSAFGLQLFEQVLTKQWGTALLYALVSVAGGLLLVWAGYALMKLFITS